MKQIIDRLQNKKAVFIVESPLQIMCAYEAIKTFEPKKVKIIVRLADAGRNNKQMEILLNEFLSDYNVQKVYLKPESRSLKSIVTVLLLLPIVTYFSLLNYNVFIGYFDSKFAKLISFFAKVDKKTYLDDGVATLNCPQSILERSYAFSIFDLKSNFFVKNKFTHLSNHLLKYKNDRKDIVVFIGSPIRQIEHLMKGDYFEAISKVKETYSTMQFFYFPHRRELKEDLDKISSYGIQIIANEYPIEMFYLEFPEYNPKVVASLYSTAMFTMSLIYGSKVIMCDGVMEEDNPVLERVFEAIKKIENIDIVAC